MLWRLCTNPNAASNPSRCVFLYHSRLMAEWSSSLWWWQLLPVVLEVLLDVSTLGTMEPTGVWGQLL